MAVETKLLIAFFVAVGAGLVIAVMRVLGAWADHHISRHDLVVESKRRRLEYFSAVAERQNALDTAAEAEEHGNVIIEGEDQDADNAPGLAA
ncbi:MAG: hypothetical protein ACE37H_18185 [Phycisphaeraceae bacterium]